MQGQSHGYQQTWQDWITDAIRIEIRQTIGTACHVDPNPVQDTPAEKLIAVIHTHPHFTGDNMNVACDMTGAEPHKPTAQGGGSNADWTLANTRFRDVYVIGPEYFHRLDWDVPKPQWGLNPVRWRRDKNAHCPVK